jgi:hypothetical protein
MITNLILAVSAFTAWTAATRFLFRRWTRNGTRVFKWPYSGEDMHPGWVVLAAAFSAQALPAIILVIGFARVVMHNPDQNRKAKTRALEAENTRLRQEQEGLPRRGTAPGSQEEEIGSETEYYNPWNTW